MEEILKHPRNEKISFDKASHVYTYCGDRNFSGVTSLIGKYTAPFDKEKIARKCAKLWGTTPSAVIAKWDAARDYGDYVHENVETYVNNDLKFETPEMELFLEKLEEYNLKPIVSEWIVYDEDIERASAIDLLCVDEEGQYVIVDVKTSKKKISKTGFKGAMMKGSLSDLPDSKYHRYAMQVNIYKYWLEEKYGLDISPVNYILRLRDDVCKMIPVIDLNNKVKKIYEDEKN